MRFNHSVRSRGHAGFAAGLVLALTLFAPSAFADETCNSPYMAKIVGQEDYVYVWTLGIPGLGDEQDQRLFYQHDPTWLGDGKDLRLLVLNNGGRRPNGESFSEVLELRLPFDDGSGFLRELNRPFGPTEPVWSYANPEGFFSAFVSGARRLAGGNTIVCSGVPGRIFEVTAEGEVVWDYYNVHGGDIEPPDHAGKAPPFSLYRAERYAPDHPGVLALD